MKYFKAKYLIILSTILLFLLFFSDSLYSNDIRFERYSIRDGLSNSNINWITQDMEGFLWIATRDGLNKYDGYKFTNYRYDPTDSNSISANFNHRIYADSSDNIWLILSVEGVGRFDKSTGRFFQYNLIDSADENRYSIARVMSDSRNNLWISTIGGGVFKIQMDNNPPVPEGEEKIIRYRHDPHNDKSLSNDTVLQVIEDSNNNIWVGTTAGLNKITAVSLKDNPPEEVTFRRYYFKSSNPGDNNFRFIREDKDGVLFLATIGGGMKKFNSNLETFESYLHNPEDLSTISSDTVFYISKEGKGGYSWVYTMHGGINRFDKNTGIFKYYTHNKDDSKSIVGDFYLFLDNDSTRGTCFGTNRGISKYNIEKDNFDNYYYKKSNEEFYDTYGVSFVRMDRSGIFWLGTQGGGLVKYNIRQNNFSRVNAGSLTPDTSHNFDESYSVDAVIQDKKGILWLGISGVGLLSYEPSTREKKFFRHDPDNPNSLSSNGISNLFEDRDGSIWISTYGGGVYILDKERKNFKRLLNDKNNLNSLAGNTARIVRQADDGSMLIGTTLGLSIYNPETGNFKTYTHIKEDSSSLSSSDVWSICQDSEGEIWVGTAIGGLARLNKKKGNFENFIKDPADTNSLNNRTVNYIYEDKAGRLWVGTYSGGLNLLDRKTKIFTHYTTRDGLASNTINGILEDNKGNLWLSTNKGISNFNPATGVFRNFDYDDGLSGYEYNLASCYKADMGNGQSMFYFGCESGFDSFIPGDIKEDDFMPPIAITEFEIMGERANLLREGAGFKEVSLSYDENFFSFEFASLDFQNPDKNIYAYKLDGFDNDWIYCGKRRYAGYTNLEPGSYKFTVIGTNSDGVWNEAGTSVIINITPPFWKTWWFYTLMAGLVVASIILIQNYRIRRKLKYVLEIERAKTGERELVREEASRDYHDELGHKLTRISLFSRRIKKRISENGESVFVSDLNSIIETSNSLQSGAKDLIWALNPEEDTLYDVAVRLKDFGNQLFESMDIAFSTEEIPEKFKGINLSMTQKRHLIYIFKEGMTNILKYARCRNVFLKFLLDDNTLIITLQDDGVGFNINSGSRGYGIKNIFNRSRQLGAETDISSVPDDGTIIRLDMELR